MLTAIEKMKIHGMITKVATSGHTLLTNAFQHFLSQSPKTDNDYLGFLKDVKEMIDSNPAYYEKQFGTSFKFFNAVKVVKIDFAEMAEAAFKKAHGDTCSFVETLLNEIFGKPDHPNPIFEKGSAATAVKETNSQSVRNQHIDEVGKCYESFKDLLRNLFADMQPTAFSEPVNARISEVYLKLSHLRNLACKHLPA